MKNHCKNSPTNVHSWINPRYEDSIDRERKLPSPRCEYCNQSLEDDNRIDERLPKINVDYPSIH